jgi:hypothetical protein
MGGKAAPKRAMSILDSSSVPLSMVWQAGDLIYVGVRQDSQYRGQFPGGRAPAEALFEHCFSMLMVGLQ